MTSVVVSSTQQKRAFWLSAKNLVLNAIVPCTESFFFLLLVVKLSPNDVYIAVDRIWKFNMFSILSTIDRQPTSSTEVEHTRIRDPGVIYVYDCRKLS